MVCHSPIMMSTEATSENFDETAYLAQNGDVARAIKAGMFASAWDHFIKTGRQEGRRQRLAARVSEARARKLERLRPYLRPDMPFMIEDGRLNFLTRELRRETRIADTENVSANLYDEEMLKLIETYKDGLILDCGAGRRDIYFENVVNYEIVAYDSTTSSASVSICLSKATRSMPSSRSRFWNMCAIPSAARRRLRAS
jgi:hypothetical protein